VAVPKYGVVQLADGRGFDWMRFNGRNFLGVPKSLLGAPNI
jgi:hypothetical protein